MGRSKDSTAELCIPQTESQSIGPGQRPPFAGRNQQSAPAGLFSISSMIAEKARAQICRTGTLSAQMGRLAVEVFHNETDKMLPKTPF